MQTKDQIRKEIKAIREKLPETGLYEISSKIIQNLISELDIDEYDSFLFFYPLKNEISLLPFASQLIGLGKTVAFPRVAGDTMDFYTVRRIDTDFEEGSFHVMEPVGDDMFDPDGKAVVCFVPGLVFDRSFYRLGYGKGYYDKYLGVHPQIKTVGICADRFFMPEIPVEETDVALDMICTESRLYKR